MKSKQNKDNFLKKHGILFILQEKYSISEIMFVSNVLNGKGFSSWCNG